MRREIFNDKNLMPSWLIDLLILNEEMDRNPIEKGSESQRIAMIIGWIISVYGLLSYDFVFQRSGGE